MTHADMTTANMMHVSGSQILSRTWADSPLNTDVKVAVQVPLKRPLVRVSASRQAPSMDALAAGPSCHRMIQLQ